MDISAIIAIVATILTAFISFLLDKYLHNKPSLLAYYLHASRHTLQTVVTANETLPENEAQHPSNIIHTHSIVVKNSGRITAHNVRIGHDFFPASSFSVDKPIEFEIREVNNTREILFPRLLPGEQIIISYLYFPPITFQQVNTYVKSDEGFAKILNVIPTPQASRWLINTIRILAFIGGAWVIYHLIMLLIFLLKHYQQPFCL